MGNCTLCDIIAEKRAAGAPPDWSGGFPWYVLGDANDNVIQVVPIAHYDTPSTDPTVTGAAVAKAIADAGSIGIAEYTIVIESVDLGAEPTHLSVTLQGS